MTMKIPAHYLFTCMLLLIGLATRAQDAASLIMQGTQLSNAGNYSAATDRFRSALALDSTNVTAKYQLAFALNAMGKGTTALPYLQQVIAAPGQTPAVLSTSYGLMAGIYDRSGQAGQAITSYQKALKIDSGNYGLLYGLGLAYFRDRQYAQAERAAIKAIKADPGQSGSMRLYGLVTFHQNKRAPALLSLCYFLWLEPKGTHSEEAYTNIQSIIQGGVLKAEPGAKPPRTDAANLALNQALTGAVAAVNKRKYIAPADRFTDQLQAIFISVGTLAQRQTGEPFFRTELATFFERLARSGHMEAFARTIAQASDKSSAAWLASHEKETAALAEWMKANKR